MLLGISSSPFPPAIQSRSRPPLTIAKMPFFAKRDTVMPAHLKEGGDFFSDTGTLHPSEGYSKKSKRSKRGKNTKKAVIWVSVLLIALVGAAAASVCFFLHMGDIDKITSMINTGKIVLPAEDAHPTHNGGLGKRAGPYGYHSIVNASSVTSSTTSVSSVASGTGSVFTETETSTLDTLLTQSPFTTVTRTTSVSYPASTTDDADISTVVVTSFVTEQPTVIETSPTGMATVTATVSQAPSVTTVTAPGSTVISTIVTQGSADAVSGSPLIPTGPLGRNSTASSAAGGLTAGSSTPTVTVVATVTPCPFANNTISSLGSTITSCEVVSGTSSESSDPTTSSCTSTASTTPNSESTSTMSPTLSPLVSISYFTETITKISNVTRTGIPPVPITATSTETVYRSTYTSVVETTVTITPDESSAVVTPAATTVFVSATVLETILVTVSVPVTVDSCDSGEALITSTQAGTVVPMPVVTPGQDDTSSVAALDIPAAAITTSTFTDLPLVSVGPNATVLITKSTDDSKTVLYFNGTSTTLTATATPTANLVSTTESATESTSPSGTPSADDVTVDVTVTLFNPVASTTPLLNSTSKTLIPNATTTVSIGMDMDTGIPLSTVVSTSIVRVNTTTSWAMPTMTMPVSDSAASQNKPGPKWWGGSNGGGATTCTMMLVAIVAFIVM